MLIREGRRIPGPAAILLVGWFAVVAVLLVGWTVASAALS